MSDHETLWVHPEHPFLSGYRLATDGEITERARELGGVFEAGTFAEVNPSIPVPFPGHYLVIPLNLDEEGRVR